MSHAGQGRIRMPLHLQILIAMVIGTIVGVAVNSGDIVLSTAVSANIVRDAGRVTLRETADSPDGTTQQVFEETFASEAAFARSYPELAKSNAQSSAEGIPITDTRVRFTYSMSGVGVTWQRAHSGVPAVTTFSASSVEKLAPFWRSLAEQYPAGFRGMVTTFAKAVGDIFLSLLKMITVPLILTSLITGVTGLGSQGRFGRMFSRTIVYYLTTSVLAIATGLVMVNLIQPGTGAILPGGGKALESAEQSLIEIVYSQILRLIPSNPFASIASGEFLSIISFAILTGTFINVVGGEHGKRMKELFHSAFEVMMSMTSWVISLAPIGVGAFMTFATASQGLDIFRTLAWYMLTVLLALLFHALLTLPLLVKLLARRSPIEFAKSMSPSLLTAFSTASSNAALPLTMNCVEDRAGISNGTSSFVLPLGATINMDGTALYEVVAVLFIAQATPGIDLSMTQQITVAFTALIASVGAAGIPHAGLVMMAIVLQAVGLPLEAQGVIIAVDRVLDMCRTTVNVWSDACGCAVVEAMEMREPQRSNSDSHVSVSDESA